MTYGMDPLKYYCTMGMINALSSIIIVLFYTVILTPKKTKLFSTAMMYLYYILIGIFFLPIRNMLTFKSIIYISTIWLPIKILFKNKPSEIVAAVAFNSLSQILSEITAVIYFLIIGISPTSAEGATNFKIVLFLSAPALIIWECVFVYIWRKIFIKDDTPVSDISSILFGTSQLLMISIFGIITFEYNILSLPLILIEALVCIMSILSFIIIIFSFKDVAKSENDIAKYESYIKNFKKRDEEMQLHCLEIRRIKHDINKHMNTLICLKNNPEDLHNYISDLDSYISEKIKNNNKKVP